MTRRMPAIAATVVLAACGGDPAVPKFEVFPSDVTLAPVAWDDVQVPWTTVTVLNDTFFPLDLKQLEVRGEGEPFVELDGPGEGAVLGVRQTLPIRLRVRPPSTPEIQRSLRDGAYSATLNFTIGGTGKVDPVTLEPDPTAYSSEKVEVPIDFKVFCDLDGDGYEAEACSGGTDCDDELAPVNPEARELCDGIDNDCDGDEDNDCIEPG